MTQSDLPAEGPDDSSRPSPVRSGGSLDGTHSARMCDAPRGLTGKSSPVRCDPSVQPVEQPRHTRNLERQQRQFRVPGHREHQGDASRPACDGVAGHGPGRPVGLRLGQPGPLPDPVGLRGDDVDALSAIQLVEPPGRPGTEASIPVEDERGAAGDRVGQLAVSAHRLLTSDSVRQPAPGVRTPRRDARSR